LAVFGGLLCFVCGCANTGESASRDKLTQNVGNYAPPPSGLNEDNKPKVGVPPFKVETAGGVKNTNNLPDLAADQMTTLLHRSGRFEVIERAQVEQLLDEQNMEGIVRPDQMAKAGQVLGVDYLLIGKVTNFRVKQDQTKTGLNLGGIGGAVGGGRFGAGNSGFDQKKQRITTECGVDIRLVDPTTGRTAVAHFGEFKRTDSAGAMGISVLSIGANADAEVSIEEDDAGKILRLAFDDALRKMMPEIDQKVMAKAGKRPEANQGRTRTVAAPAEEADDEGADAGEDAATPPARNNAAGTTNGGAAAAKKFCGECGAQVAAGAKFCPKCGKPVQ
jgi:curli biogenesis system outer membrane secretion channel CsgG